MFFRIQIPSEKKNCGRLQTKFLKFYDNLVEHDRTLPVGIVFLGCCFSVGVPDTLPSALTPRPADAQRMQDQMVCLSEFRRIDDSPVRVLHLWIPGDAPGLVAMNALTMIAGSGCVMTVAVGPLGRR
jgi:hypothetical protein